MTEVALTGTATTCLVDIVFPGDTNHHGTLFGGVGLAHMDKVAFIAASRHAHLDFVTASCERLDFVAPAYLSDIIELTGRVIRVGKRSLGVEVEMIAESPLSGERRHCGRGVFNMVAIGGDGRSLPPLPSGQADATPGIVEMVFPGKTSHYGSLYGGNALAAMGKAAFVASSRLCRKAMVMASSQRVDFESQILTGEVIEVIPRVSAVGRTSVTVDVDLLAENLHSGERRPCGHGTFVMVAVDAAHQPTAAMQTAA